MDKGIHIYSWNLGGASWETLEEWVDTLSQEADWDLLLLQETFRNVDIRHLQVPQGWDVLNTSGGGRAAPAIVINRKLSGYLVDSVYGETFVGAAFGLTPPLPLRELEDKMQQWESRYPGAKIVIGMDANCQFTPWPPLVGPKAAGERYVDERRAESFYGFFQRHALKAVSTYWHSGPTRQGVGGKAEESSAQIDFLLATEHLAFWGKTRSDLYATIGSDHKLLGMVVSHIPKDEGARRAYFQHLNQEPGQCCLPKTWQPRDEGVFKKMLRYDRQEDLSKEMTRIRQIATTRCQPLLEEVMARPQRGKMYAFASCVSTSHSGRTAPIAKHEDAF